MSVSQIHSSKLQKIRKFQRIVLKHFAGNGRTFPWRETTNPYHVLVSEYMLQQTQVLRVVPKYTAFINRFPDIETLARAQQSSVVRMWQGLGYNRRARFLHESARLIYKKSGVIPQKEHELVALPGIGAYTASAISAFAYNKPSVFVETNIRTALTHHFFFGRENIAEKEYLLLAKETLYRENPREWYMALMDYGAYLKKEVGNLNSKARVYTKQSRFQGSDRELRGAIIRTLVTLGPLHATKLVAHTKRKAEEVERQVLQLTNEGMLKKERSIVRLA